MNTADQKTSNELSAERTDLAATRTVMAADRSLMAWIRTGLSMISFGVTIYKMLQAFQESESVSTDEFSPRRIGLFLTGLGTVSILIGAIEYWQTMKTLGKSHSARVWRPAFVIAAIISVAGLFLFTSLFLRLF